MEQNDFQNRYKEIQDWDALSLHVLILYVYKRYK